MPMQLFRQVAVAGQVTDGSPDGVPGNSGDVREMSHCGRQVGALEVLLQDAENLLLPWAEIVILWWVGHSRWL